MRKNLLKMKFVVLTTIMSLFMLYASTVNGQTAIFTIGDSVGTNTNTSYPTPFGDWYKTMRTQYLYLASEMTAAGMGAGDITEIRFWVSEPVLVGDIPGLTEDYTIYLKNTATTSLAAGTWESDAEVVWGPYDNTPTTGAWNIFTLDAPFYWDGTSNLILEICGGDNLGTYTDNGLVAWETGLPFNGSRTYRTDGATVGGICGYALTTENGTPTTRPVVRFNAATGDDCTGTPDAGSATASAESVCTIDELTVSVTAVLGFGITYQWESSTDGGGSWDPIVGATSESYSTFQEVATSYRCVVTCTASGESSTSTEVAVGQNAATDCYCEPVYSFGTSDGDYCSYVGIGDISNSTDGAEAPYYTYYSDLSTDLFTGTEYTLEATTGSYTSSNGLAAWIDFNADGDFSDEGELIGSQGTLGAFTSAFFTFTVPADAVIGETRLRVREIYAISAAPDACADASFGETEDYNVQIMEAGEDFCNPVAPGGLFVDGITATSGVVHWDAVANADQYIGALWNLSTGAIGKFKPTGETTTYALSPVLTPSTTFGVRLKTVCFDEGMISAYSDWYYFTTDPLREGAFNKEVMVYPNPNNGAFRLQLNGYESGVAQVTIVNSMGQMVYDASVSIDGTASVHDIALQIAPGTYFVKVINGSDIVTNAIIVE